MRIRMLLLLAGISAATAITQASVNQTVNQENIYLPLVSTSSTGRIAYVNDGTADWSIHVVDGDGTGDHAITDFPLTMPDNPSWSPDGTRLAFDMFEQDVSSRQIYVMQDDGSNVQRITNDPVGASDPAWSPDGSRIAFVAHRDGNGEIYVMDADGSNPVRLTNHPSLDAEPAWSPDGSRIVFSSRRDLDTEIYVMSANGSNLTRLTTVEGVDSNPAWSPNGLWIAFCSQRGGPGGSFVPPDLYVMNSDGSGAVNLTNTDEYINCWPTWSADSARIAFTLGRILPTAPSSAIYTIGVNGTGTAYLAGSFRYNFRSDWSR